MAEQIVTEPGRDAEVTLREITKETVSCVPAAGGPCPFYEKLVLSTPEKNITVSL